MLYPDILSSIPYSIFYTPYSDHSDLHFSLSSCLFFYYLIVRLPEVSKTFAKQFACGCSVVKGTTSDEINIQGDFVDDVIDLLSGKFNVSRIPIALVFSLSFCCRILIHSLPLVLYHLRSTKTLSRLLKKRKRRSNRKAFLLSCRRVYISYSVIK